MDGRRNNDETSSDEVRLLCGALPGRDVHDPHAPRQPLLRRQPHRSLLPHLHHLFPRILSAGGDWRQGQPRDDDFAGSGGVPADGR